MPKLNGIVGGGAKAPGGEGGPSSPKASSEAALLAQLTQMQQQMQQMQQLLKKQGASPAAPERKVRFTSPSAASTAASTAAPTAAPEASSAEEKKQKKKKKKGKKAESAPASAGSSANPFAAAAASSDANPFAAPAGGKKGGKGGENPFATKPAAPTVLSVAFNGILQKKPPDELQKLFESLVGDYTLTMLLKERAGRVNCKVKTFLLAVVQLLKGRGVSDEVIACVIAVFTNDRDASVKEQVVKHGASVWKQLQWLCDGNQLLSKCQGALKSSGLSEGLITTASIKEGAITNAKMVLDAYNA